MPVPRKRRQTDSVNQSIFYFMSVHIEVVLDKKQQQQKQQQQHILISYTNFPTGL